MNDSVYPRKAHDVYGGVGSPPSAARIKLAERALGAYVSFKSAGDRQFHKGRIVFTDYDTLNVLVNVGEAQERLVSLKDCRVLTLRSTPIPVLHGARLNIWVHGEGWYGVGIADPRVADTWLGLPVAVAA